MSTAVSSMASAAVLLKLLSARHAASPRMPAAVSPLRNAITNTSNEMPTA